jgi:lysophospholipase L1-like esterase
MELSMLSSLISSGLRRYGDRLVAACSSVRSAVVLAVPLAGGPCGFFLPLQFSGGSHLLPGFSEWLSSTRESSARVKAAALASRSKDVLVAAAVPGPPVVGAGQTAAERISPGVLAKAGAEHARLPSGRTVLHVGDSFAGALGQDLNRELAERGVRGIVRFETATYIPTWASGNRLGRYVERYKPDLVLVNLGANDLEVTDLQSRAKTVRRLVAQLKGTPCVWIGIPLWEGARRQLSQVIEENSAPCLYLDSNQAVPRLERARDGIHPSQVGRRRWARAVVEWLEERTDAHSTERWSWLPPPSSRAER